MVDTRKPAALRSSCPIAAALDLIGDRWTLVVVRDLMFTPKSRFGDLLAGPEGITTNILTDRLRRLEAAEIVARRPYQTAPPRYDYLLTDKGRDLFDVLAAMIRWGGRHTECTMKFPDAAIEAMDPRGEGICKKA